MFALKKLQRVRKLLVFITIFLISSHVISGMNYPRDLKVFNQEKYLVLKNRLAEDAIKLIFLTVTGDKYFNSKFLFKKYKDLQIIHLLVISGSNITVFLIFTYLVIGRKNMFNFYLRYFLTLGYAKFIGYPEPFVRAIVSTSISDFFISKGIKTSYIKELILLFIISGIIYIITRSGNSFILSLIFSVSISIFNRFIRPLNNSVFINFLLFIR